MKNIVYLAGLLIMAFCLSSCEGIWPNCIDGNGEIITSQRDVGSFDRIETNGDFQVFIYVGDTGYVEVESDENLMGAIITRVYKDELIIETRRGDCLRPSDDIRITVITPGLRRVELNGSGSIWCDSLLSSTFSTFEADIDGSGNIECIYLQTESLETDISGSGTIKATGTFDETNADIEGSGEIMLTGQSPNTDFDIVGSGKISARNLLTDTCYADITGSGSISAWVIDLLDVEISGSGVVYYYGESPVVNTHISGSGRVIKKD
ncbi:MAG: DUF2807 domain-containing protein [Bacteroidales bacterium]|nr:DUF2807 domain-containing protein [Bacteroidales bacterium]